MWLSEFTGQWEKILKSFGVWLWSFIGCIKRANLSA
jgi:hypothetical protein